MHCSGMNLYILWTLGKKLTFSAMAFRLLFVHNAQMLPKWSFPQLGCGKHVKNVDNFPRGVFASVEKRDVKQSY